MSDKHKNDDFTEAESASQSPQSNQGSMYQFYVDATPHEVVSHIRQLEDISRQGITYRVTPSSVEAGTHFEVRRIESHQGSSKHTVVTGHISLYDASTERSFVTIQTALAGPGLVIFLGVAGFVIFLMSLGGAPMAPTAACNLFILVGLPILGGMFLASSFDANRHRILEIVANHLMLLRKNTPVLTTPIDREQYE